jgi:two-component system, NarL family, response regulator DevR
MEDTAPRHQGPGQQRIRVFLLEDHEVMRMGLRAVLSAEPDIEVVGDAGTVAAALARLPAARPEVAILDVRLPDGDGISACRAMRSMLPDVACLMFTAFQDDQALLGAVMAGAAGYVLKGAPVQDVVEAVRVLAGGKSILDAGAAQRIIAQLQGGVSAGGQGDDRVASLTGQEKRVLDLIGEGLTNRQIAERMSLAEKTAKNYVSSLLMKLGLQRRSQAAVVAVRHASRLLLIYGDAVPAVRAGRPGDEHRGDRAEDAELDGQVGEVERTAAGERQVDPVHHAAAPQPGRPEEPVGEVAERAAEHRRQAERGDPAGDPHRQRRGHRGDAESDERHQDRVAGQDAAARAVVPDDADGEPAEREPVVDSPGGYQGFGHLVGGQHGDRDPGHGPAHGA